MSKKSRRRNKKILGALAAGLGAMALMKRGQGTASTNPVGGVDQIAADAVTGTSYPGANKAVVASPAKKSNWISPRMHGGSTDKGVSAQNKRADYAQRMRNAVTGVDAPPSILNPYRAPVQQKGRLWTRPYKSGGRVKGCGIAKRGLGRAIKKGRK